MAAEMKTKMLKLAVVNKMLTFKNCTNHSVEFFHLLDLKLGKKKENMLCITDMLYGTCTCSSSCGAHSCWQYISEITLKYLMGYRVDILHDVVTANDRSTIVDPMAESSETCMFSARAAVLADVAACLLQAAGETVCLLLQ